MHALVTRVDDVPAFAGFSWVLKWGNRACPAFTHGMGHWRGGCSRGSVMTRVTCRMASSFGSDAPLPSRLGRYALLTRIAAGGMGEVWAAEHAGDLGFRKLVAVKTMRADLASNLQLRAMFADESCLAALVRHPNVIEVLDFGVEGTTLYQVMSFVDGSSVATWIEERAGAPLPAGVASRLVVDLLCGLEAVHDLGIAHRDVSPQNLVVGKDGIARLTDFGIAKPFHPSSFGGARAPSGPILDFERTAEETEPNGIRGKLGYLAPELLVPMPADARSDLYAAGVVLWEALTGRKLFAVADDVIPLQREDVPDVRDVAPVPDALAEVVRRALDSDPAWRFQSAREMTEALERASEALDATHGHVAAVFARDLGMRVDRQRETIADIAATAHAFHGYDEHVATLRTARAR